MMIYGLNTCAVCQKARKALEADGKDISAMSGPTH